MNDPTVVYVKALTVKKVAAMKNKTPRTVRRWCDKGWIACEKGDDGHWHICMSETAIKEFTPPRTGPVKGRHVELG